MPPWRCGTRTLSSICRNAASNPQRTSSRFHCFLSLQPCAKEDLLARFSHFESSLHSTSFQTSDYRWLHWRPNGFCQFCADGPAGLLPNPVSKRRQLGVSLIRCVWPNTDSRLQPSRCAAAPGDSSASERIGWKHLKYAAAWIPFKPSSPRVCAVFHTQAFHPAFDCSLSQHVWTSFSSDVW